MPILNNTGIRVILFDLGGVLVELDGPPFKSHWLRQPMKEEDNWRAWASSPHVEAFESGHSNPHEFASGMIAEFDLVVGVDDFIREFTAWPKGLYAGVPEYLTTLRGKYRLACYSNTSELHWSRMMNDMGLAKLLHRCYASFQIGCYKPSQTGFDFIVRDLQVRAEEILFFDDNAANVEAAKNAGLEARLARGLTTVKQALG